LLYKKWFSLFGLTKKSVGGSAQELFWTVNEDVKVNYGQGYTIGLERSH